MPESREARVVASEHADSHLQVDLHNTAAATWSTGRWSYWSLFEWKYKKKVAAAARTNSKLKEQLIDYFLKKVTTPWQNPFNEISGYFIKQIIIKMLQSIGLTVVML